MTLVVVIIGVIAALVYPRLDSIMPKQALRAAGSEVAGVVAHARAQARLTRQDIDLLYDIDGNAMVIEVPGPPLDSLGVRRGEPEVLMRRAMPQGVKIARVYYAESMMAQSGGAVATFRPSGTVGEHMVELENTDGDRMSIFVPAMSGSPFVVEEGYTYAQVRAERRYK